MADAATDDVRGLTTIEATQEALSTLQQQQDTTEDACANTAMEGQSLLRELRCDRGNGFYKNVNFYGCIITNSEEKRATI